jgi:hypothetical protein
MADDRGNQKPPDGGDTSRGNDERVEGRLAALPEFARRVIGLGLSGFFLTEETIRKALGDTLPKDWADFVVDQSERTRKEFLERLSFELAQTLEKVDVAQVLKELLEGRTLEVRAEIRLGGERTQMHAAFRDDEEKR